MTKFKDDEVGAKKQVFLETVFVSISSHDYIVFS